MCPSCDQSCRLTIDAPRPGDPWEEGATGLVYDEARGGLVAEGISGLCFRVHDGLVSCDGPRSPYWSRVFLDVEVSSGSRVDLAFRTAETTAALHEELWHATDPGDDEVAHLAAIMEEEGLPQRLRYLEVRVTVGGGPGEDRALFRSMTLEHYCLCSCDRDDACTAGCRCDWDC